MSDIKEKAMLAWDRKHSYYNLKEKFQDDLNFSHSDGMWCANREFIAFLTAFQDVDQIIIEDIYNVPRIVNPVDLLVISKEKYQFAANTWAVEYNKLATVRRPDNV